MYSCTGKIFNAAGVIEVEMSQNDMANVPRIEPEPAHLSDSRLFWPQLNIVEIEKEFGQAPVRVLDISCTKPGVHQDQSGLALDQQAMTNQSAKRCVRSAVK